MTRLNGAFRVMGWEEGPYDDVQGAPTLARAAVTHELSGDIDGEASIMYLMSYAPDTSASLVGLVRVTGKIGDREGSFVARDIGKFENGEAKGYWTILDGADGFRGIRGHGHYTATHEFASYSLECELA